MSAANGVALVVRAAAVVGTSTTTGKKAYFYAPQVIPVGAVLASEATEWLASGLVTAVDVGEEEVAQAAEAAAQAEALALLAADGVGTQMPPAPPEGSVFVATADGAPAPVLIADAPTGQPAPEPVPEDATPPVAKPKQAAPKEDWENYAQSKGMSEAEAKATAKKTLIERFGGE